MPNDEAWAVNCPVDVLVVILLVDGAAASVVEPLGKFSLIGAETGSGVKGTTPSTKLAIVTSTLFVRS